MLRRCDLAGASCLDVGSMEGLIPVLMARGGASRVVATDFRDHCGEKMEAVFAAFGARVDFQSVGLMYDLHKKIAGGFDLINCSGVLYHVWSPLHVLAGLRPLLKRNGLMIVSTNVVMDDGFTMDFNNAGRMQAEANTFWYPTVQLLEYLLRYLRLVPVDAIWYDPASIDSTIDYLFEKPTAHLSVLCRAVDAPDGDEWMQSSTQSSWEYLGLSDWRRADRQPVSTVNARNDQSPIADLREWMRSSVPVRGAAATADSHTLLLEHQS
jgi:SAM-dependent methyltransferase